MTVAATSRRQKFIGSGTTGPFTFNFRVLSSADIIVTKVSAAGVRTTLTNPADYSIALVGGGQSGGAITTVATVAGDGSYLVVEGNTPLSQPTDFRNQGRFASQRHENSYDRSALQTQEIGDKLLRSFILPPETTLSNILLPNPVAGAIIAIWNPTADGLLIGPTASEIAGAQGYGEMSRNYAITAYNTIITGTVSDYSSLSWATQSQYWAVTDEDTLVPNGGGEYSAKHHAAKGAASAAAAAASAASIDFDLQQTILSSQVFG